MADFEKGQGAPPPYNPGYPPQQGYQPHQDYPPQQSGYAQQGYPPQGYPPQGYGAPAGPTYYDGGQGRSDGHQPPEQDDYLIQSGRFSDADVRRGFIRKVYSILFIQFGITTIFTIVFCYSDSAAKWARSPAGEAVMWANLAVLIITEIALVCCEGVRRKHPVNLIVLFIFTCSMSLFVGIIASTYAKEAVLTAAGATALIVLALTLFSFQTKFDFTGAGPYLFVVIICFMIFGIFASIFRSNTLNIVYACLGVLIFSMYLVYDTQLIVGGKKYQLSEEEYVFGALSIYIDVIQIFLFLLELFGRR